MTTKRRIEALEETLANKERAMVRDPVFEAEREKAILAHPDSRRIASELLRKAIECIRSGKDPDQDESLVKLDNDLWEIGGGHWYPLGVVIMHDDQTRELAYQFLDAEAEARKGGLS